MCGMHGYIYVYLHICEHTRMRMMFVCIWRPQVGVRCPLLFLPLCLLRQYPLLNLDLLNSAS